MAKRAKSKGQAVIELTLSTIMFTILVTLVASVSIYLYVQHSVVSAAREGVRVASTDPNFESGGNQAQGITDVKNRVKDFMASATGQTLDDSNSEIDVTPPDATDPQGQRTVQVQVTYTMQNPIPIADFIAAVGSSGSADSNNPLKEIPVTATATMRFEE